MAVRQVDGRVLVPRPYWTWRSYLFGVAGLLCSVASMYLLGIYVESFYKGNPLCGELITVLLLKDYTLMLPWLIFSILGFLWPFGILHRLSSGITHLPFGITSWPFGITHPTHGALTDALLSVEEGACDSLSQVLFSFRACTKGQNKLLVQDRCRKNAALLNTLGVPSIIEVVTDSCLGLPDVRSISRRDLTQLAGCVGVVQLVVPSTYRTSTNALFKCRALNYALHDGGSCLNDDDIVVHLDEETLLHQSSVFGILEFARTVLCKHGQDNWIGQGAMVYGHGDIENTFLTCADSVRVCDDYCKFRLMFSMGVSWLGMKGSFVVCRAGLERQITFDFGPEGSVTEDAWFALEAGKLGCKFSFVDGYMCEASPFSVQDFFKQRRRWIQGLRLVATAEFPRRIKCLLDMVTRVWLLAPLSQPFFLFVYTVFARCEIALPMSVRALVAGTSMWAYIFGACYNFTSGRGRLRYVFHVALVTLLSPMFGILEGLCVLYTWVTPAKAGKPAFHVVKKERSQAQLPSILDGEWSSPALAPPCISNCDVSLAV